MLMESIRDYAVFGDDYTRSATVKALLNKMERKMGNLQRLAFETLVAIGEFAPDEPLELRRESIATAFSDEALAAADAITDATLLAEPQRLDLTAAPIVTIDDAGTADKDDALSLERTDESHNGGRRISARRTHPRTPARSSRRRARSMTKPTAVWRRSTFPTGLYRCCPTPSRTARAALKAANRAPP